MIAESESICLRCGCPILIGQPKKYRFKLCEDPTLPPGSMLAYDIDQHFSAEDCMVALRRKEVER